LVLDDVTNDVDENVGVEIVKKALECRHRRQCCCGESSQPARRPGLECRHREVC
jgi:hypothetical protein